ncbi:MAG: hypothetical protein ACYDAQ_09150 [Mycobacteriales bacterium]
MTEHGRDHTHIVHNGKRELNLDELARMQPGLDRLMAELGPRMHRLYYAGAAGNWGLAGYFFKSVVKQLRLCGASRPRYDPELSTYLAEDCQPVGDAIKRADGPAFEAAYHRMVDRANHYHAHFGKPYIAWRLPERPPEDLDLTAGTAAKE